MVNDKRYHPIRKLDDHEGYLEVRYDNPVYFEWIHSRRKNKGLVSIDISQSNKMGYFEYVLPVALFFEAKSKCKNHWKDTTFAVLLLMMKSKKKRFGRKIDHLQNPKFRELRGLKQSFYVIRTNLLMTLILIISTTTSIEMDSIRLSRLE